MTVTRPPGWRNRAAVIVAAVFLVNGCSGGFDITDPIGTINRATGTKKKEAVSSIVYGVVAGDERAAVSVGNSILLQGGSAADAAAAMSLALSVTYPSRASLAGGGVCLVGGGRSGKVRVLDFLPTTSTAKSATADRPSGIPAMVRGMAALHAEYGRMPWRGIVTPAQAFARDGFVTTETFAKDLKQFSAPLFADPVSRSIFSNKQGKAVTAGRRIRQFDLSTVLALVGGRGAGEFYRGPLARRIVDATIAAGGTLKSDDLRNFLPKWRDPVSVQIGDSVVYAAPPPTSSGLMALQMLQLAIASGTQASGSPVDQGHLIAEAAKRSLAERTHWLGDDFGASAETQQFLSASHATALMKGYSTSRSTAPIRSVNKGGLTKEFDASTSFVVADGEGLVVTCTLTMYHLFGTGRTAPGLGILLSAATDTKGRNPLPLGSVVVMRARDNAFRFAFSASGNDTSTTALANVMIRSLLAKQDLRSAISGPRIHYTIASDEMVIEDREDKERLVGLISRGHRVKRLRKIGRVNAIACLDGLPAIIPDCEVVADPRGEGVAATVQFQKQER